MRKDRLSAILACPQCEGVDDLMRISSSQHHPAGFPSTLWGERTGQQLTECPSMSRFITDTLPNIFASSGRTVSLWDHLDLWLHRYFSRRHLAQLDEHMLKDIGMTRLDAEHEALKPFWRD